MAWRACTVVISWLTLVGSVRAEEPTPPSAAPPKAAPASDAAVRGLFGAPRATVDPELAELQALWEELAGRPLADTAGKPGLERAAAELARLRELIERRAEPARIARGKQRVWAALSLTDRQIARAELAHALQAAMLRRQEIEAQLKAAEAPPPEFAE